MCVSKLILSSARKYRAYTTVDIEESFFSAAREREMMMMMVMMMMYCNILSPHSDSLHFTCGRIELNFIIFSVV